MSIDERIPAFSDAELKTLLANAARLLQSGTPKQKLEAERLLPLIEAETAERKARTPAPVAKKPRVTGVKKVAKKAAPKKKAVAKQ